MRVSFSSVAVLTAARVVRDGGAPIKREPRVVRVSAPSLDQSLWFQRGESRELESDWGHSGDVTFNLAAHSPFPAGGPPKAPHVGLGDPELSLLRNLSFSETRS